MEERIRALEEQQARILQMIQTMSSALDTIHEQQDLVIRTLKSYAEEIEKIVH